jgi:hypothetical protein
LPELAPGSAQTRAPGDSVPLTEEILARLWAGQRFPASALVTASGVALRVLHPGRRGRGAGPDFRDAVIAPPSGRLLRGDVELHVRAVDFRGHGHDSDHNYDRVVLHVVFEDGGAAETLLASGRRVPVVALSSWVRRRAQELSGWLASPPLWREPCADAIARLGRDGVLCELAALGDARFDGRVAVLSAEIATHGAGGALYHALLDALGYGGGRALMAHVAHALTWPRLEAALAAAPPADRARVAEALLLEAVSGGFDVHVRPANHPSRRLAGLAVLLARHWPLEDAGPDGDPRELIAAWTAGPPTGGRVAAVGRSRAIELLANAVLPWRAARCEAFGDGEGARAARAAFAALPAPARYGKLAFLEANLSLDERPLKLDARSQQGLLALYKTECTQGGCGRCVLS